MLTTETNDGTGAPAPTPNRGTVRRRVRTLAGAALLGAAYWTLVRPRMMNWGATPAETTRTLPGDGLVPDPDGESTMAIRIDAPAAAIWPWLRQLGQERGGFYSYEWAENLVGLDIHNADEIVPEYQNLSVGDTVRLGRADRYPDLKLEVDAMDPERSLVLRSPDQPPWWVWSFVLDPVGVSETRLLVRSRIRLSENPAIRLASQVVLDPVTFMMTSGMLLGIRKRAEAMDPAEESTTASVDGEESTTASVDGEESTTASIDDHDREAVTD